MAAPAGARVTRRSAPSVKGTFRTPTIQAVTPQFAANNAAFHYGAPRGQPDLPWNAGRARYATLTNDRREILSAGYDTTPNNQKAAYLHDVLDELEQLAGQPPGAAKDAVEAVRLLRDIIEVYDQPDAATRNNAKKLVVNDFAKIVEQASILIRNIRRLPEYAAASPPNQRIMLQKGIRTLFERLSQGGNLELAGVAGALAGPFPNLIAVEGAAAAAGAAAGGAAAGGAAAAGPGGAVVVALPANLITQISDIATNASSVVNGAAGDIGTHVNQAIIAFRALHTSMAAAHPEIADTAYDATIDVISALRRVAAVRAVAFDAANRNTFITNLNAAIKTLGAAVDLLNMPADHDAALGALPASTLHAALTAYTGAADDAARNAAATAATVAKAYIAARITTALAVANIPGLAVLDAIPGAPIGDLAGRTAFRGGRRHRKTHHKAHRKTHRKAGRKAHRKTGHRKNRKTGRK